MRPLILFMTAASVLQACQQTVVTPVAPAVDLSSCQADSARRLVGQDVSLLPDNGRWATHRVIYPDQAVTQDFSATRLNLNVNADGVIQSMYCG